MKFPKYPDILGIPQIYSHSRNFQISIKYHPEIPQGIWENFRNTSNAWESGKFPKCLRICLIPQIPGNLTNSPNTWESGEFPKFSRKSEGSLFFIYSKFLKCLTDVIYEICQKPRHLGNFPNIQ